MKEISIGGNTVTVEVARDQRKRYVGLSEKEDLGKDEGMLFVWPMEKEHGLVMRDMSFGVDMVFADSDGNITKVHSAPKTGEGETALSKYAVELPKGWCSTNGIEEGDRLNLSRSEIGKHNIPTLKDEIAEAFFERADMDISMFSALAVETPDPEVEEVDAPYNEVEGETPSGDTDDSETVKYVQNGWKEKNGEKVRNLVPLTEVVKAVRDLRKKWIPYVGPQGGEGWQNVETDEVRYQQDPPGEVHEDYSGDYWERHSGSDYPPEERQPDDPEEGVAVTEFITELPDLDIEETSNEDFVSGVQRKIEQEPEMGAFLTAHDPEEMEDHTLLRVQNEDVDAGVSVSPDGDIQNVFKIKGPTGTGRRLVEEAVENGGRTLDCYAGYLNRAYRQHGFREVARQEFNPQFSPEDWNEEKYGQPDVVFMSYDPDQEPERTDTYISDWGEAKELSREKANWDNTMEEKQSDIQIPEDEEGVVEIAGEDEEEGEELSEEEKNLAIAQAKLIGDL